MIQVPAGMLCIICITCAMIFHESSMSQLSTIIIKSLNPRSIFSHLQPLHQRKPFLHPCRPHDGHGWLMPREFSRGFPAGPQPSQREEGHLQAPWYLFFPDITHGLRSVRTPERSTNYAPWTISMHGEVWNSCTVLYYVCLEYNFV